MWTSDTVLKLGTVALIWSVWCVQHSLLNSEGPLGRTRIFLPGIRPYYRIIYNVIAVITLVLASKLTPRGDEFSIIVWYWPLKLVPVLVWTLGFFIFWLTFRRLGWLEFLGLRGIGLSLKKASGKKLITRGIYGTVRHPQFSAGLMMLWVRDLQDTDLVINIVLSAYLIIGARIEERRLVDQFGDEYLRYRKVVPAFVPDRIPHFFAGTNTSTRV